jgi:hypothetical protein
MREENKPEKNLEKATGRYVYDKKIKKVVKISDEIVGLKKSSDSDIIENPCSHGECGYNSDSGCIGDSCSYNQGE